MDIITNKKIGTYKAYVSLTQTLTQYTHNNIKQAEWMHNLKKKTNKKTSFHNSAAVLHIVRMDCGTISHFRYRFTIDL